MCILSIYLKQEQATLNDSHDSALDEFMKSKLTNSDTVGLKPKISTILKQRGKMKRELKLKLENLGKYLAKRIQSLPRVELAAEEKNELEDEY